MRHSFALVALSATTALAAIPGLPQCAQNCVTNLGTCGATDVKCICSDTSLIAGLACCVGQTCDAADQAAVITLADSLCVGQGVTNLPSAATCAPGASSAIPSSLLTSSGTASASSATVSSSATLSSTPASLSSAIASASAAASSTAASVSSSQSAAQASTSTSASSAASTTSTSSNTAAASTTASSSAAAASASAESGAMGNHVEGMGLGLAVAGLLAML